MKILMKIDMKLRTKSKNLTIKGIKTIDTDIWF